MKAVRIHAYGPGNAMVYEDALRPEPGEQDVLIRVQAASVNPVDLAFRAGYMTTYFPLDLPAILGCDVAGIIQAVGSGVRNLRIGEEVYARTDLYRLGGYAEYVLVSAAEVVLKPSTLNFTQAAALPHAALTAWRSLFDAGQLSAGQTVLIHAAAGGVGSIAVQLAKSKGARVIGTASSGNQDLLAELGVDVRIDYTAGPFEDKVSGVDVVFDTVGGETQERSFKTLKPGGVLVSVVSPPSAENAAAYGVRAVMAGGMPPVAPVLTEGSLLVEAGKLKPVVSHILPLADAQRAHDLLATRHTRGKIILVPA
jgi:NADPH:quinone reductase-like Zn-dependent oxidoreductase